MINIRRLWGVGLAGLLFLAMLMTAEVSLADAVVKKPRVALLSTSFVLEKKFQLMEAAAHEAGVDLAWVQVDKADEAGIARALAGSNWLIVDAPRNDDTALIEARAGKLLREKSLPGVSINVMSPPNRMKPFGPNGATAQRVFDYYIAGMPVNRTNMFRYIRATLTGESTTSLPPPQPLPNGGIYHPGFESKVFGTLPEYLDWWSEKHGRRWRGKPVIAMEMSSSYISDGQTRMLDETIAALEARGAMPLFFYRSTRSSRIVAESRPVGNAQAAAGSGGRPGARVAASDNSSESARGSKPAEPVDELAAFNPGFPNPKASRAAEINEPLITLSGELLPNVLLVNTFIGGDPEGRKAWYQALGIPTLYLLTYRTGDREAYYKDLAGVNSFFLPFTLTLSEYIGMQDPVLLTANESGELVPMPEQMDLLVGKAMNIARLQTMPNAQKKIALLFWNHPPGEKNQGASNLNVPRSIEALVTRLKTEGYRFDQPTEQQIINTVGQMLRPKYRKGAISDLMKTPHWAFMPMAEYKAWYSRLPVKVRKEVEGHFGQPEQSPWVVNYKGQQGFVIPRMALGNLVVMPQPGRGEMNTDEDEKKLFHDTKVPLSHSYMATYLWIRQPFDAAAIVHFGTHGTQEWTPGKERGMWAYDYPNLLVGNTPVIYPYIVDNISEAIHVKRRGRGVIVSHQTPAFAPAGLSDDFVRINDLIREYESVDEGLVKRNNRKLIVEQVVKMNIHKDLKWKVADLDRNFDDLLRDLEDYLETLGAAMQPLGLHTLGRSAEEAHQISNVMQMIGQPLYDAMVVKSARVAFRGDYKQLVESKPYRFVADWVYVDRPLDALADPKLIKLAKKGREYRALLDAGAEFDAVVTALNARWIDPSYGGDPIRNPDALKTGRNMYGFDPSRVPTRAAYEAGKEAIENLIATHKLQHGVYPKKLTFSVWSTETMRHLGMLEAQILYAMGVKPVWNEGGQVVGMELIPFRELGRPRIDPVISITGLYRDQFPNVMERFNEAIALVADLDEPDNAVAANSMRIERLLLKDGFEPTMARNYARTRIFGNESGDYGTKLPDATLASDKWEEGDGKLEKLYLSRMSWSYGPDVGQWSQKLIRSDGSEVNVYAEQLRGTDAAVFSRSSNLRGLLDTDHPFEYLGGISMAVRYLDGKSPQLYISNMRDASKAKLETAERFMANELRAVYQHPRWMAEMQKEGYSGTLKMLDSLNNFWGWQVMDRNIVRDDQWQEFNASWIQDRYKLGMRDWFEKSNPTALAQIAERMLEAIRKDYWKADEATKKELVALYQELARKHDVHTNNETFKAYVSELVQGFGLAQPAQSGHVSKRANVSGRHTEAAIQPRIKAAEVVRGQEMKEVNQEKPLAKLIWTYAWMLLAVVTAGMLWQAWNSRRTEKI